MRVAAGRVVARPLMIFWLDNSESVVGAPNENYGRELLELFSMGVGNYTEDDIKAAAYSFTGWTFEQPIPLYPHGGYPARFVYRDDLHDHSEKEFLGHKGNFNGEDIIDIIVQQPATGRFIGRHLYNFFVKDEPGVSAWSVTDPGNPEAVAELASAFAESNGDLRAVMRVPVQRGVGSKRPATSASSARPSGFAGAYKLSGNLGVPQPEMWNLHMTMGAMGQSLMDPPSVEGWHTGKEWIDGGTLMERINFASKLVSDPSTPGVQELVGRLQEQGASSPEDLVNAALDFAGPLEVSENTREALLAAASEGGELSFDGDEAIEAAGQRAAQALRLVIASPEYQFA